MQEQPTRLLLQGLPAAQAGRLHQAAAQGRQQSQARVRTALPACPPPACPPACRPARHGCPTAARPPAPPCSAGADHHGSSPLFLATLRGHTDAVGGLAFSADGTALATACEDRSVRVFALADLATGKQLAFRSKALRRGPVDVAFVDDAEHVAVMTKGAPHLGTKTPGCLSA